MNFPASTSGTLVRRDLPHPDGGRLHLLYRLEETADGEPIGVSVRAFTPPAKEVRR